MEDHSILLKIKRQFTKDESIAALLKMISEFRVEIGVQQSEIEELRQENVSLILENRNLSRQKKQQPPEIRTRKSWLKDDLFATIKSEMKEKDAVVHSLIGEVKKYQQMYLELHTKIKQHEPIN